MCVRVKNMKRFGEQKQLGDWECHETPNSILNIYSQKDLIFANFSFTLNAQRNDQKHFNRIEDAGGINFVVV